ncbi:hypothetical protein Pan44_07970 [Caulifigura coniformis]|uniref:Uncharacterized protein n=1 Tax=Caulifigura coniformis TaxID=2527983 RepID=A0A517S9I0_9PLAN|nr:hypothetical protein [Caulifigura coniformis]QDT52785.1 hypothetical protein Pan44_07970 [Caulifigura coniformis]
METIIRNVRDLPEVDRSAAEQLVGHELTPDQQLVIVVQYSRGQALAPKSTGSTPKLPDWCNVFSGLNDQEVADLEEVILSRADLSRATE